MESAQASEEKRGQADISIASKINGALAVLALLGALPAAASPAAGGFAGLPGADGAAARLLAGFRAKSLTHGPLEFGEPAVGRDEIVWTMRPERGGRRLGTIVLRPRDPSAPSRAPGRSFRIEAHAFHMDPELGDALIRAGRRIEENDDGFFAEAHAGHAAHEPPFAGRAGALAAGATVWAAFLAMWAARRGLRFRSELRARHTIIVLLQGSLYLYWGLYEPRVWSWMPMIGAQLVFAYLVDMTLGLAVYGSWVAGASPIPVVFSVNLFAWHQYPPTAALVVVLALLTKHIVKRDGRHVFNPSAFGLSAAALLSAFLPGVFGGTGTVPNFESPANMVELLLILSFAGQARFPIALTTLAAGLFLEGGARLGVSGPGLLLHGTLLSFVLLLTDPATIPRTGEGKVLYGAVYAALVFVIYNVMGIWGLPDSYSKIYPVLAVNWLCPAFDRWGASFPSAARSALSIRYNAAHIACWLALMIGLLWTVKPLQFRRVLNWSLGTPIVGYDEDGIPRCGANPAFCRPFAFLAEARAWRKAF